MLNFLHFVSCHKGREHVDGHVLSAGFLLARNGRNRLWDTVESTDVHSFRRDGLSHGGGAD